VGEQVSIASEAAAAPNQLQTALRQGLDNLGRNQVITFTQYTKQTVAQDGYVFWVNSSSTLAAKGSLHYGTERDQSADQTAGINSVIFTSETEVTAFNSVGAGILWIASFPVEGGGTLYIAFSGRGSFYEQAGLWHYTGFAVYPAMQSQLINSASDLPAGPIVSNSGPIFLSAAASIASLPGSQAATYPAYLSYLLPENITPPYISVHVEPGMTEAVQQFPRYKWSQKTGSGPYQVPDTQLMRDHVTLTLYGMNNAQARQWLSGLIIYTLATENFGFMTAPAIQDDKRAQPEIAALAMKKSITFDASYFQGTADAITRQLILSASVSFQIEGIS